MSKLTPDQLKAIKEAQDNANILLRDSSSFDKAFEELFPKFDKNKDKTIGMGEYLEFINGMLSAAGKKKMDLPVVMLNFDRADKDGDGYIDKEEFKKELKKRLNEFVSRKY